MSDMTDTILYSGKEDDTTEALLAEYDDKRRQRPDDVIAMQTAVCMTAALLLLVLDIFYPDTAEGVLHELKRFMTDTSFTVKNPVDIIISYIQSR